MAETASPGEWYEAKTVPHILVAEDEGRKALIVDGAVQSVAADDGHRGSGYWAAMIPHEKPRRALILGLGAGTVAHLLTRRFGPVPIVAIDDDPEVVEVARSEFALDLPNVQVEIADAFEFVAQTAQRFDLILIDLYHGPHPAPGTLGQPFLSDIYRILLPRGQVVFNCFSSYITPKRRARLDALFRQISIVHAASNRIIFCR